ncbi:MAG TPA: B12-binding domain-containing protein, partial [Acidimicrobiales bacterium]|nr:B12-binding domain-containing protein [Acidimicrobiales bacterium]
PTDAVAALNAPQPMAPQVGRARRAPHRSRLITRMLAADAPGAWSVVERALASGTSPRRVELELIVPSLRDIGDGWARGEISIGQEHTATAVASRLIGRLGPLLTRRGPTRGAVVLAGAPGERHTLCMVMLADLLRADGWQVVELGGDTPVRELAAAVRTVDRLAAVAICVGSDETRAEATESAAAVRAANDSVAVLIGGPGITDEDVARSLGADGFGRDADEVNAVLDLLTR